MGAGGFLERARHEALRYGSDPWVFVRELLQNARDAGASSVTVEAAERGGTARVVFLDDGQGMSFDHARRYLFALYASSKEGERGAAGRFGVGFWSVLRFDPARLIVRSWPPRGTPWEVELDGALTQAATRTPPPRRTSGTEIILERPGGDGDLARRVRDAAWQSGRFLSRRADRRCPLDVRINGERVSAHFDLPAPSASFRKGRWRGVVALGPEARVELFSQGLRVRAASALEDLLSPEGSSELTRVRFPTLAEGVAPQAMLDGDELEPLLARADVRDTPRLRRMVALAQRELRRLIERQIDILRPRPWHERWRRPLLAAAAVLVAGGGGYWLATRGAWDGLPTAVKEAVQHADPTAAPPPTYRDLRSVYAGPRSDVYPASAKPLALTYWPPAQSLRFAALVLERPFEPPPAPVDAGAYPAAAIDMGFADVTLSIDDGPGPLRLPLPTGHRVDPTSVRLGGRPMPLRITTSGEPFLALATRERAMLTYRTGAGTVVRPATLQVPALPAPELAEIAARLRALDEKDRLAAALGWVRERVAYSTAPAVVARHRTALAAGRPLLPATLEIGAADCDVQNSVLVTLLQAAGVHARLAVGYVGENGVALAPPHAWVEWSAGGEPWQVADASLTTRDTEPPTMPAIDTPVVAFDASAPASVVPRAWLAGGFATLAAGLAALSLVFVRTRRVVRLAPGQDVCALLQGALQHPEAFRDVPALYRRPLVPCLAGRAVSLAEASRHAAERRLFRSAGRSELARRTVGARLVVLDATRTEGRAVADALGAVDLDEWDSFLKRAHRTGLLDFVGRRLRELGEPWDLYALPALGAPCLLDLPSPEGTTRIVVLDADEGWLRAAEALRAVRPHAAVLAVADRLAEIAQWNAADRSALLVPLARGALREATP